MIIDRRLGSIPVEAVVAAVQTMGPHGEKRIINGLMEHISDELTRLLRRRIGRNHPNEGFDMIERAHDQMINAVLKPNSADGAGLREAFEARVSFRASDAISHGRKNAQRYPHAEDFAILPEPETPDGFSPEEITHVEGVLSRIIDPKKRLAFRLHMDGVPKESKKGNSIERALGISAKTAGDWIEEIQKQLKQIVGDRA